GGGESAGVRRAWESFSRLDASASAQPSGPWSSSVGPSCSGSTYRRTRRPARRRPTRRPPRSRVGGVAFGHVDRRCGATRGIPPTDAPRPAGSLAPGLAFEGADRSVTGSRERVGCSLGPPPPEKADAVSGAFPPRAGTPNQPTTDLSESSALTWTFALGGERLSNGRGWIVASLSRASP